MKISLSILIPVICLLPLFAACKKEPKVLVETSGGDVVAVKAKNVIWPAVEEVLRSQISALNREDLPAYMSYIHPESSNFTATRNTVEEGFLKYDLKHTLEKAEPGVLTDSEAKVRFVQLTEKVSGPAFRNNRISGTHVLRKDGGVWKIFSTVQDSLDYLDPAP